MCPGATIHVSFTSNLSQFSINWHAPVDRNGQKETTIRMLKSFHETPTMPKMCSTEQKQDHQRTVPRMGLLSLSKMCKCNFHRNQAFSRAHPKPRLKRQSSIRAGDVLACAIRRQARRLGIAAFENGSFGQKHTKDYSIREGHQKRE